MWLWPCQWSVLLYILIYCQFFTFQVRNGVSVYLRFIFLMINEVKYLVICLSTIFLSTSVNYLLMPTIFPFLKIMVKIHSMTSPLLLNFQVHSIVSHLYIVVQQISRTFSSFMTVTVYPLNSNCPISLPNLCDHHSTFCLCELDNFKYLMSVERHSFCLSKIDLFYFA